MIGHAFRATIACLSQFRAARGVGAAALLAVGITVPASAETITVTHWGSAFYGAPYAVALEKGFFKKHGVDITGFLTSAGGGTSVRNMLAGDLPFGEVALPAAVLAIQAGQPIKIISGGVESVGDITWVAKPDTPIAGLADVKGKKIAYTSAGSVSNMILLMCLQKAGLDPKAVQTIAAGDIGANLSAVLNGAVDAAFTNEPLWSQNKTKVKLAFQAKDCTDVNITQTVGVTTTDFATSGADKLKAIVAARKEGVDFIKANPDEAADIVAKAYNGDPKLYREVFRNLVAMNYFGDGRLIYPNLDRMAGGMELVGRLKGKVDWKAMADESFLPAPAPAQR
ncbi:aliphatic sulfonate ABC transporter substrate-binding protein [Azorhizobium oxalatiphilum]|uniref:Aliphatic sulfonate ABC transporter substrate-binding protein n=1 Tax=Azorhizobium oxalatiphilum TaxID=980631 RepID=A0A917BWJ5_9HYPH|nr:ABC transporter substrate-binding protein [Azorhizobium oxalatiphilum]GGF61316.1 aliphatic sulfonate ABC transporter substrate-binding protein [Azorhizobium oxalatiphilum]